jgi:hypothetical protein
MGKKSVTCHIFYSAFILFIISSTINLSIAAEPAGYYFESNGILQFRNGEIPNMTYLYDNLYSTNLISQTIKDPNPSYLLKNSDGSFTFLNVTQFSNTHGGSIIIENETLFFDGPNSGGFLPGNWRLSNSKIISNTNPVNFQAERLGNYNLHNITFVNINSFTLNAQSNFQSYSGNISNVSVYDSRNGLLLKHFEPGGYIRNLYFENIERQSFLLDNASFYDISDITIENGGDYTNPKTYVGFLVAGGHDNTIRNISVNGSPWSGVDLTSSEYNTTLENIYVNHAGHNGVDFHGQWNCSIENVVVNGSVAENFMITGRDDLYRPSYEVVDWTPSNSIRVTHTIKITNYTSYNSTGVALSANRYIGLEVVNLTSRNNGGGFLINYAMDTWIQNAEIYDRENKPALTLGGAGRAAVYNTTIVDSYFSGYAWFLGAINTRILNTILPKFSVSGETDYFNSYYVDVQVIDSLKNPISYSIIDFSSNQPSFESINSLCEDKSKFITSLEGRTHFPFENRSNSPALIENYKNNLEKVNLLFSYQSTITTPDGKSILLTGISPDSTWYREDPNIPTYTITAIIPDNSTSGPNIIGFAPREDNPFVPGSSKKFRVWTDETLTSMNWYVNGNLVSSGSLEYNWNIQEGSHTINFEGTNGNGAVMQSWSISEEPEVPEEPKAPESSGSGTSYTPSTTSFTSSIGASTNFIVDTDEQFTSTQWYFNGAAVASDTTSYTQNWAASGSFSVSFEGTTDLGTTTRTWNVVVSGSEYSAISIVPSASVVAPGETFSLDVYIDPKQPVTGAQFNMHYSTLASVTSVRDGGLFKVDGLTSTFQSGLIDNSAGVVRDVYSAITGSGTVSTAGSMATINMTAGATSGMLELTLSNVVLSDAYSNPAPYDITYASILVDTAPVFNTIPAMSVEEESGLAFVVSATDADGDTLTYSNASMPQGATFDASTGTFSWTPARGQAGTYNVEFEVTDGYLNDTATAAITVTSLNRAPVITLFEPASGSEFVEGQVIDISVVAEDPEGEPLSYSLTINGIQVSSSASYRWVTDYSSAGTHSIGVTVSDGNSQASQTHTVTILDVHPRWDVNQDGVVNILDITLVGQNYGNTYSEDLPRWDVNQDGVVNIQDLSIVAARFGETL